MVLAMLALLTAQVPPRPLLDQMGVKPTGRNGYEELVQAAELLWQGRFPVLREVDRALTSGAEVPNAEHLAWAKAQFEGMNGLQRKRYLVERFRKATELVKEAAKKPIFEPRTDVDIATLFPELSGFRMLTHHLANVAHVERSYGRDITAVETWTMTLHCMDRVQRSTLISYLVGRAGQATMLNGIATALPHLSHSAAEQLEEAAKQFTQRRSPFVETLTAELKWMRKLPDEMEKGTSLNAMFADEDGWFQEKWKTLSEAERQRLPGVFERKLVQAEGVIMEWAAGGPRAWLNPPEWTLQPGGDVLEQMSERMIATALPILDTPARYAALFVVQLRLLHVSAAVARYQWEHGRLPAKLSDVLDASAIECPLSGKPFVLERPSTGAFVVKSPGVPKTGEITMTSTLPRGSAGPADP